MTRRFAVLLLLGLALAAGATGCSKSHRVEIESDTCWAGYINGDLLLADCGNAKYKIVGRLGCVRVRKNTATGFLRVRIDQRPWVETTASLGEVQVCN